MIYRILADLTVIIHFAYVSFVIGGLFITLLGWIRNWSWVRNRWFRTIHLVMILVVVGEAWAGVTCPLTTWEQEFRTAAGQQTYQGDFIANCLHDTMFVSLPAGVLTFAYTIFAALVLATLYLVPPRWRVRMDPN